MPIDDSRRSNLLGLASLALVAAVPGCGGGGGGGGGSSSGTSAALQSLELTTPVTTVPPGQSVSLAAAARYSDGTRTPLTSSASWQSSNPAAATVSSDGRVNAIAAGSTIITVSYQSITATLTLRVGQPLQSLQLWMVPFALALGVGGTWQLFTIGHAIGDSSDVRAHALWSSSDPGVATVGQGTEGGLVRGVGPGTTTITCTLDGLMATVRITVLSHQRIAHSVDDVMAVQCLVAVDGSGRALAIWTSGFPKAGRPDLSWSQFRPGTGWSAAASLRPLPLSADARSASLTLSLHENGSGWAAWQQSDGLYAARFEPVRGWAAPVQVDRTGTGLGVFPNELAMQVDRNGNALLVWRTLAGGVTQFRSSVLNGSSGQWTPAMSIPDTQVDGVLAWWKLVANKNGDATLLWARAALFTTPAGAAVLATRWQPGSAGEAGRWVARETLLTAPRGLPGALDACMDDAGVTLVGWAQTLDRQTTPGRTLDTLRTRRHVPGQGWQAEQILVAETDLAPRQLALASVAGQGAGAVWANAWDNSVWGARMAIDGSWRILDEASDNSSPLAEVGAPSQLGVTQLSDGRMIVSWLASDNFIGGSLGTRVHHPTNGWGPLRRNNGLGRIGASMCLSLAYTADGLGTVVWLDRNQSGSDLFGHTGWQP